MSWAARFRLREWAHGSLWLVPLVAGVVGAVAGILISLVDQHVDLILDVAARAYFIERGEIRFAGPSSELRGRDDLLRSVFLTGSLAG